MPPSAGWGESVVTVLAAMAFGAVLGLTTVYAVEAAGADHPHAMVGIAAIVFGVPSGMLLGAIAAVLWLVIRRPTSVMRTAAWLFGYALFGVVFFFVIVGQRW
jgi:hypothetical protein